MATVKKRILSGSMDGLGIVVAATATLGTEIHEAVAGTTPGTYDEVWLWAMNNDDADAVLTIEFGDDAVLLHGFTDRCWFGLGVGFDDFFGSRSHDFCPVYFRKI